MSAQVALEALIADRTPHRPLVLVIRLDVLPQRVLAHEALIAPRTLKVLDARVFLLVQFEVGGEGELHVAVGARVRLDSGVGSFVLYQLTAARERFVAEVAVKRLLSRVNAHVHLESLLDTERPGADVTLERLDSRVAGLVRPQAAQLREPSRAVAAAVRFLSRVDPHMFDEVTARAHHLIAHGADVSLGGRFGDSRRGGRVQQLSHCKLGPRRAAAVQRLPIQVQQEPAGARWRQGAPLRHQLAQTRLVVVRGEVGALAGRRATHWLWRPQRRRRVLFHGEQQPRCVHGSVWPARRCEGDGGAGAAGRSRQGGVRVPRPRRRRPGRTGGGGVLMAMRRRLCRPYCQQLIDGRALQRGTHRRHLAAAVRRLRGGGLLCFCRRRSSRSRRRRLLSAHGARRRICRIKRVSLQVCTKAGYADTYGGLCDLHGTKIGDGGRIAKRG